MNERVSRFGAGFAVMVTAIALAGIAGSPGRAAAQAPNIVLNGGFETPAINGQSQTQPAGAPGLAPWVIGGNSIDLIKNFWQAAEGSQSIDLDGSGPGSITQTLTTLPGRSYLLRFKYSGHPDRGSHAPKMTVRWSPNGVASFTEQFTFTGKSTKSNMGWVPFEKIVTATSAETTLSFTSDDPQNPHGIALDDVSVTVLPKADQATLTVTGPSSVTYGTTGTATATGGTGTGALSFSAGASTGCSVSGTTVSVSNASGTCSLTATRAGDANYNPTASAAFPVILVPPPFATPSLLRVVATGGTGAFLIGRVDGASSLPITLQVFAASVCTNGALIVPTTVATAITLMTDAAGYFSTPVTGVAAGNFVAVQVTSPALTATSACIASSGDNDSWPKALEVIDTSPTARDYIDAQGKARWYKFTVAPGQKIQVTLSGLPADYDLAVFKDIGAAFLAQLVPANTAALTKLSAEFAPSVFSPSVFSPSVFSPSVFSPDAYAPSVFSPSVFSPSVFSPSVFSATEIAQAFSSAQTRSIIGVSATPGTGDEFVIVNTWNNTGSFYVRVAGRAGAFTTSGQFQVDVTKGATSCAALTNTTLTPRSAVIGSGLTTVILTDSSKVDQNVAPSVTLRSKLDALALAARVGGIVVDVAGDTRVEALKTQAANNPTCPFAKNLLAEEIKGIVDSYRANPLRYVVIVGNDNAIPFFRYPDQSLLGQESGYVPPVASNSASEASLRGDFVLSQDAYGSGTQISLRTSGFPVPGLAVGRLVESPQDIAGLIDAFLTNDDNITNGVVSPRSSLVTGYDFLEDAANAVCKELASGTGADSMICGPGARSTGSLHTLITPNGKSPEDPASWTATQLGDALLGSRHDVVFLAGHFSANSALAADFSTSLITTELAASTVDLTNSIVFSAGCHSGYNLVDGDAIDGVTLKLDWAQAFAQKKATLIAGTGYQYGDTDFLEYSERLYHNFARQLRAGPAGTAISVGGALVKAKLDYLAATPDIRGIHEKALLEATLFGLPMLGVNMPAGRGVISGPGGAITPVAVSSPPAASLGLLTWDLNVAPTLTPRTVVLTSVEPPQTNVTAAWWEGPQGVVSNPAEPALPLAAVNVTPTVNTIVLRGVGFRGGVYADDVIIPLTGAPTTELRGVHVPFVSPVFFPMRTWSVNYFGALGGNGGTSLLVTPAQHRAADIALGTSTRRTFTNLDLRLYYSGNLGSASLSDAPSIVRVEALPAGGGVAFTAQVVGDPKAAIHEVWITYTFDGATAWTSLNLSQCVAPLPAACLTTEDSRVWKGSLPTSPLHLKYVVQAVNGYGLVTLDDNLGAYYGLGGAAQAATAVEFVSAPTGATFGDSPTVTATLKSAGVPLADKSVIVAVGGAARVGTTNTSGIVTVNVPIVSVPGSYKIIVSFGGDQEYLPSSASGPFVVGQATASFSALLPLPSPKVGTTLIASLGGKTQRLLQEAVTFSLSASPTSPILKTIVAITDYLGRATLPPTGLPAGTYVLKAEFAGNTTYTGAVATQSLAIAQQTISFGDTALPSTLAFGSDPITFTVSSSSGLPVTVGLSPGSSLHCALSGAGPTYTLTALAPGLCTLVASAGGTTTYTDVIVKQDIAITKGDQTIVFNALANKVFGDPPFTVSATGGATGNPVTFNSQTTPVCTVSGNSVAIVGGGACTIAADQAGNTYYNAAPTVIRSFTVNQAPQTITFAQPATPAVFSSTFGVSASSDSGLTVTIAAGGACSIASGTVTMTSGTGTCTVTASQAGNTNYSAATDVVRSVAAAKAPQAITVPLVITPPSPTFVAGGAGTFQVGATAPGGTVTFSSSTPLVCTVSGTTVTMKSAGLCTLVADHAGDHRYLPAPQVIQTVTVGKGSQTIAFTSPGDQTLGTPPLVLVATASSSLPVTFAATGNCTVSGTTLTLTTTGSCTITAGQGGNANFAAAPDVQHTFLIDLANVWTLTAGNMTVARSYHTATAFTSGALAGWVLIAGGLDINGASTASSELYDPATRTFTSAGNMPSKSAGHTATLLPNEKVFVVGGGNSSAQVFDPVTRTWSPGGSLSSNRSYHTATLLGDGKVLIVGGADNAGKTLSSTIVYNPAGGGSFVSGPALDTARERHTASVLPNGKVLIVGGRAKTGNNYKTHATYQICDATACTSSLNGGGQRDSHAAVALVTLSGEAKVLVTGGSNGTVDLPSAELYDTAAGTWGSAGLGSLLPARRELTLSSLPNGRALAAGGRGKATQASADAPLSAADVYAPPIAPVAPMNVTRAGHTATPLKDANGNIVGILVTGGVSSTSGKSVNSAETYGSP